MDLSAVPVAVNENLPEIGCPSSATVRQTTLYSPSEGRKTSAEIEVFFTSMQETSTASPVESVIAISLELARSKISSENTTETVCTPASAVEPAAGLV